MADNGHFAIYGRRRKLRTTIPEAVLQVPGGPRAVLGGQRFRSAGFFMSMSRTWSVTIGLRRLFFRSRSLSRLTSSQFMPP